MDAEDVAEILNLKDSSSETLVEELLDDYFHLDYEIQVLLDNYLKEMNSDNK